MTRDICCRHDKALTQTLNNYYFINQQCQKLHKNFINNNNSDPESSENPKKAVIHLNLQYGVSPEKYTEIYDALISVYNELRNEESMRKYGVNSNQLLHLQLQELHTNYPIQISQLTLVSISPDKFIFETMCKDESIVFSEPFISVEQMPTLGDCKDETCTQKAI